MSKARSAPMASDATDATVTPIGVDVGVKHLAVAAPAGAGPSEALVVDGDPVREQYHHLVETMRALEWSHDGPTGQAAVFAAYYHRIRAQLGDGAARVVDHAREHPAPVLVLEDLEHPERPLWAFRSEGDFGTWVIPAFQRVLTDRATEAGIPVARVDPKYTTKECHECREFAVVEEESIRCTTDDCPVDVVDRDRSAALSIARRFGGP